MIIGAAVLSKQPNASSRFGMDNCTSGTGAPRNHNISNESPIWLLLTEQQQRILLINLKAELAEDIHP